LKKEDILKKLLTFTSRHPLLCVLSARGVFMSYTVKQLAKLSGVSSRTLRFYDEIGLLKPAYYGDNNYRYYQQEQLLLLQQILFFRELGFPLNDIQKIMACNEFDKIEALQGHKLILNNSIERAATLLKTIDKTIGHLKGNLIMKDIEMYEGFDFKKQQEYEQFMVDKGILTQQEIKESWDNVRHWKKNNWEQHNKECSELNEALVNAINNQMKPESQEVQELIQRHFDWVKQFWTPTKQSYTGLGKMYLEHPDFTVFYNAFHPNLAKFLAEGMRIYAMQKLD
jgi:DNA-binding transcriptional MerR regulator